MFVVRFNSALGLDTTSVSDAGNTRVVLIVTVLLILLGTGLAVLTGWFWKNTKPDPEALGPLLKMSARQFAELDPIEQRHRLDQLRPSLSEAKKNVVLPAMEPPVDLEPVLPDESESATEDQDDDAMNGESVSDAESSLAKTTATLAVGSEEIDWDDDEWPDVDDWSLPGDRHEEVDVIFDQEAEEVSEDVVEDIPESLPPQRAPISIDPLLGF